MAEAVRRKHSVDVTTAHPPIRRHRPFGAALKLQPWAWSTLGVLTILATPAAGLIATAAELRRLQPSAALLALAVLGVLAVAALAALSGG